jgi:hypothetical protein
MNAQEIRVQSASIAPLERVPFWTMQRPLRLSVVCSNPNVQPNCVTKSATNLIPLGKIRLHFQVIQVQGSVLGLSSLFLTSLQFRSTN